METLERIWELVSGFFASLALGIERAITSLFGSSNARYIKKLQAKVERINALEPKFQAMSDDQLKQQTVEFRRRLAAGETLDDLLVEAFAACRESGRRFLGMRHYDVQMIGGMILHAGNIAEMVTGEGKTLVATLPCYLNALEGKGVHVVTVNDYLARRDMEWMGPLYMGLGLTVGAIQTGLDGAERQRVLCLRHHLRHEQRVRLRLFARQHAAGGPRRQPLSQALAAGPGAVALRDYRRSRQHPDRRSPHAAHYRRPRPRRRQPLCPGGQSRSAAQARDPFRGQGERADGPPDGRGGARGRETGRRRELLHRRQHGMAPPDRQRA